MNRALTLTIAAAALWMLGGTWYYDCKIKRVCGPETAAVVVTEPAETAPAAPESAEPRAAEPATVTPALTLPPAPAPSPLPTLETSGPTLVLTVSFDARSAALQPPADAAARLEVLRQGIAQGRKVLVLGHSDGLGARARISVVSQQRADALRDWLLAQGIPATAIAAVESREDREPIASNSRAEGRSQNRRAEAVLAPLS
ncbi:MAG: OmpA family protein [Stagnimonas sp.]|nr:OmpA family protein [Stagnimonas sp.]